MTTYDTIIPLVRYSPQAVTTTGTLATIDMQHVHLARMTVPVGAVTGTVTLRVYVNTAPSMTGAVEITSAAQTVAANTTVVYAIRSDSVAQAMANARYVIVRLDVGDGASATVGVDAAGIVPRYASKPLPAGFAQIDV